MNELDIELTAACDKLRIIVRNEQAEKDYADEWHKLSQTSTQRRKVQNETRVSTVQISVRNYAR